MCLTPGNGFPGRLTSDLHLCIVGTEPSCSVTAYSCVFPLPDGLQAGPKKPPRLIGEGQELGLTGGTHRNVVIASHSHPSEKPMINNYRFKSHSSSE